RSHIHILTLTLMLRLPPTTTLFPYTTLFRSCECQEIDSDVNVKHGGGYKSSERKAHPSPDHFCDGNGQDWGALSSRSFCTRLHRSEEHTSELQSRRDLVCRLLLEKKKNKRKQ